MEDHYAILSQVNGSADTVYLTYLGYLTATLSNLVQPSLPY